MNQIPRTANRSYSQYPYNNMSPNRYSTQSSNQNFQPSNVRNSYTRQMNYSRANSPTIAFGVPTTDFGKSNSGFRMASPDSGLRMPMEQMARQSPMSAMSTYQYQPISSFAPKAFAGKKLFSGGLLGTIQTAQKGLNTANQVIPLVNQMRPLWNNVKTVLNVAKAMKDTSNFDIDDEIDRNVVVNVSEEDIREAEIVEPKEDSTEEIRLQPTTKANNIDNLPTIF